MSEKLVPSAVQIEEKFPQWEQGSTHLENVTTHNPHGRGEEQSSLRKCP